MAINQGWVMSGDAESYGADLAVREDNVPIGYLRAFVTVLVVAHHSLIAYLPDTKVPSMAAWTSPNLLWTAFPVVAVNACRASDFLSASTTSSSCR